MKFLLLVILSALSYGLTCVAAPLINPIHKSCSHFSFPTLEAEVINADDPKLPEALFSDLTGDRDADSGETLGYSPYPLLAGQDAATEPWSAPKAERLLPLHPDKIGLYYRNRVLNLTSYPWNAIGRVEFRRFSRDKGGWCTGSLVGRNLVLTASHCFPWGYGSDRWMRFTPGFSNSVEPYGGSYISRCRGVKNTFNVTGIDYVVCELCESLGDQTGWMKTKWWKDRRRYLDRTWRTSGYPIDAFNGQAQMGLRSISLKKVDRHGELGVELESDVFAAAGWSGGPMWDFLDGEPTIVGVCSGGERDCSESPGGCYGIGEGGEYHDVSAGGRLMTHLVRYGLAHWRPDSPDPQSS